MIREEFEKKLVHLNVFAEKFYYELSVKEWIVLLKRKLISGRSICIEIDFSNFLVLSFYTLSYENDLVQYSEYLTFEEIMELANIIDFVK